MFMQGSSLSPILSIFEKIFSAYFGYQKGVERGVVSRAWTLSGRTVPEMLTVGEGGIYMLFALTQESRKFPGTGKNKYGCGVREIQ